MTRITTREKMDKINPPSRQKILHQINLWQESIFVKAFIDSICLISLPTSVLYVPHQRSIMGRTLEKTSFENSLDVKGKKAHFVHNLWRKSLTKSITWIFQNSSWTNCILLYPFRESFPLLGSSAEIYLQIIF